MFANIGISRQKKQVQKLNEVDFPEGAPTPLYPGLPCWSTDARQPGRTSGPRMPRLVSVRPLLRSRVRTAISDGAADDELEIAAMDLDAAIALATAFHPRHPGARGARNAAALMSAQDTLVLANDRLEALRRRCGRQIIE